MTEPITPAPAATATVSSIRHGMSVADLKQSFVDNLVCALGRGPKLATRSRPVRRSRTHRARSRPRHAACRQSARSPARLRVVAYLSAEFLPGPHLMNNLLNLGIVEPMRQALAELEMDLDELPSRRKNRASATAASGRLASCYMDSMASLDVPRSGTASGTSSASSIRPSRTAGRRRSPTSGCATGIPGRSRVPRSPARCGPAATPRSGTTITGGSASAGCPATS